AAYVSTFLITVIGNILLITVIIQNKGGNMKNVTNVLIINICLCNLLIAFSVVPFRLVEAVYKYYVLGSFSCIMMPALEKVLFTLAILHIMVLAIVRHRAIVFPLKAKPKLRHAIYISLFLWAVAIVSATPVMVGMPVHNITADICSVQFCEPQLWSPGFYRIYYIYLVLINDIPLAITVAIYIHIYLVIDRRKVEGSDINLTLKTNLKVLRMLIAMLVASLVCWLPYSSLVFILSITTLSFPGRATLLSVCKWIAISNCCCDPIICVAFNKGFRNGLKAVFC
ncbi:uncharacterized protein TRIADDRAFT_5049, partial [Trichoplax adhaerens]